jgi:hypothetical protein
LEKALIDIADLLFCAGLDESNADARPTSSGALAIASMALVAPRRSRSRRVKYFARGSSVGMSARRFGSAAIDMRAKKNTMPALRLQGGVHDAVRATPRTLLSRESLERQRPALRP